MEVVDINGIGGHIGGLVEANGGSITRSFWDTQTSGLVVYRWGIGLPTADMQNIDPFLEAGWDFMGEWYNGTSDIWTMPEQDYPRLTWEFAEPNQ